MMLITVLFALLPNCILRSTSPMDWVGGQRPDCALLLRSRCPVCSSGVLPGSRLQAGQPVSNVPMELPSRGIIKQRLGRSRA